MIQAQVVPRTPVVVRAGGVTANAYASLAIDLPHRIPHRIMYDSRVKRTVDRNVWRVKNWIWTLASGVNALARVEVKQMASWEPALIAAIAKASGGENPIETIDHQAKVIEIKRDARVDAAVLRGIERAVEALGIGYRVEQLS